MRESVKIYATKAAAGLLVAGALAVPLYLTSTPGRSLERPTDGVVGHARVVDGDTLEIDGVRVRLEGIDAPEIGQSCPGRWFGRWSAGRDAAAEMRQMIAGAAVSCRSTGADAYGRMLGQCSANGLDLNREMVRRGFAWAFVKYSTRFVADENFARTARAGIWRSTCAPAWEYRAAKWTGGADQAPSGCAIKGNITSRGRRIYHMPWGRWYRRTKIETARGERWFCSEAEAIRAGWQASRN
ncbi:MAG: thermonuclease family protein [Hyphomicrobiaceae bacterium]|nr:thermonuclease family protein [Hyphomicrobiaceae bacterium]